MNYLSLTGLSKEEFAKQHVSLLKTADATKSNKEDIKKIENLLQVRPGILDGIDFYVEPQECVCGRLLTFSDFIYTALVEQWHDPSFIVHVLVGSKYFVNEPRQITCSECGSNNKKRGPAVTMYETTVYGCCGNLP